MENDLLRAQTFKSFYEGILLVLLNTMLVFPDREAASVTLEISNLLAN